ncbi:Dicer-like protein 1 [Massospora cicadina]|nr:Dicer-like protein 1 [Massospora cicadina]
MSQPWRVLMGVRGGLTFQPAPKVPEFWLPLESQWPAFWINVVQLDPSSKAYQPFALITRKPLPALHLLKIPSAPSSIVAQVALAGEPFIPDPDHVDTLSDFTSRIFGVILNDSKGSRDPGVPFLLAPLTCRHEPDQAWRYVDWEMVRTKGLTPLRCDASVRDLVVCDGSGSLGSLYYHKRDVTSCEVDVNTLEPVLKGNRKKEPIPEDLMWVHWLSGPFARSMMMLPALMNRVDSILLLKHFKAKLGIEFVKDEFLLEAVTFRSAHQEVDYERLEFLGDTFLKLLASVDVCIRAPDSSPEQLFNGYVSIARNSSLSTAGQGVNLQAYFVTQPFDTGAWRPPPFSRLKPTPKSVPLGKSLADVVEATLGASLLSVGESQTIRCAKALGIPIGEFYSWGDYRRVYLQLSPPPNHKAPINLGGVQALLNYHFSNPGYLAEALAGLLTHPPTVGYRRLVFLGDALLNYFTVTYLFLSYPEATPGELTATKSACLRRATLVRAMHSKALGNTLHALIGAILMDSGFELEAALAFFNSDLRPFYQQLIPEANLISEGKSACTDGQADERTPSIPQLRILPLRFANPLLDINFNLPSSPINSFASCSCGEPRLGAANGRQACYRRGWPYALANDIMAIDRPHPLTQLNATSSYLDIKFKAKVLTDRNAGPHITWMAILETCSGAYTITETVTWNLDK